MVKSRNSRNGILCEYFLCILDAFETVIKDEFLAAYPGDEKTYSKISDAYQIGVEMVYDVWRDIYRAFIIRYGRAPSPDELKKYENFILVFIKSIAEHPSVFSVTIRNKIVRSSTKPNLFFDADGALQFDAQELRKAQVHIHDILSSQPNDDLRLVMVNRYCPALPRMTRITQMCCDIFGATYAHIYNNYPNTAPSAGKQIPGEHNSPVAMLIQRFRHIVHL